MSVLTKVGREIILNVKNIPGWKSKRKIVVFECDDYGGIRMPSQSVFNQLLERGLRVATSRFNLFDTLETAEDLDHLFTILTSVRDNNSRHAVFSPMTIVANPDFESIESSGFSSYVCESFDKTLLSYYPGTKVLDLWRHGIDEGIFIPGLHGRDHTTVKLWLRKLRDGDKDLAFAFKNRFVSLSVPGVPPAADEFRAEYFHASPEERPFLKDAIRESVLIFENIFGTKPHVFVPGNGIFHPDLDGIVAQAGIPALNVTTWMPYPDDQGKLKHRYFFPGQTGPGNLLYYNRNCAFEPTDNLYTGIDSTLKQIEAAFRWNKPAIISSHRVNFCGGISPANRTRGLVELKKLLVAILKIWPSAEFMSSGEMINLFVTEKNKHISIRDL